jgi:hypothetical protein
MLQRKAPRDEIEKRFGRSCIADTLKDAAMEALRRHLGEVAERDVVEARLSADPHFEAYFSRSPKANATLVYSAGLLSEHKTEPEVAALLSEIAGCSDVPELREAARRALGG